MKPPLKLDGLHSYIVMGFKIMTKSKNRQFFHENHELGKVVEMKGTDDSFIPIGFSRIGIERLKN